MRFREHLVCVRSAYTDPSLSETRLELSRRTIVPSLRNQDVPFRLCLRIDSADPLLTERVELFRQLDVPIQYDLHPNKTCTLWSRIDDDDAVADNYLQQVQFWSSRGKTYVGFDRGLVSNNGKLFKAKIPGNMFASAVSHDPDWHIFTQNHRALQKLRMRNAALIHDESAWIWVRHSTTKSKCLSRYLGEETTFPGDRYSGVELL
mgnify:CR=1 FL=1